MTRSTVSAHEHDGIRLEDRVLTGYGDTGLVICIEPQRKRPYMLQMLTGPERGECLWYSRARVGEVVGVAA